MITPLVAFLARNRHKFFCDKVMRYVASREVTAAPAGSTHGAHPLFPKLAYMIVNDKQYCWISGRTVDLVYCHTCWNADGVDSKKFIGWGLLRLGS